MYLYLFLFFLIKCLIVCSVQSSQRKSMNKTANAMSDEILSNYHWRTEFTGDAPSFVFRVALVAAPAALPPNQLIPE